MESKEMKICVVGCGLRTPLLVHGLVKSGLNIARVTLYDVAQARSKLMLALCQLIVKDSPLEIETKIRLEDALTGSSFVISSIRVGDLAARARDERLAVECGVAGQETTGPSGFAMALRTVPVALSLAKSIQETAPDAWLVNFTNPAGLITQALTTQTNVKTVGICDTPGELIHQVVRALGEPADDVRCDYFGLNHLGWIDRVRVRGEDNLERILADGDLLRRLYPAELFPVELLRELRLLPSEYLFYYYNGQRALANQVTVGMTRGEELLRLNESLLAEMQRQLDFANAEAALSVYRRYLNRRNSSYMRLEGAGESAFAMPDVAWDPFEAETGYHRIAVDAIAALSGRPQTIILNVPNGRIIPCLAPEDVIEVTCHVDQDGARALEIGPLPELVRPLLQSVKQYERLTLKAALERRQTLAILALMSNPIVGCWDIAERYVRGLLAREPTLLL